jgi:hypothetical protein
MIHGPVHPLLHVECCYNFIISSVHRLVLLYNLVCPCKGAELTLGPNGSLVCSSNVMEDLLFVLLSFQIVLVAITQ